MSENAGKYQIVVGFDGSKGSYKAVEWAVTEAECRKAHLRLVQAWTSGEFGTDEDREKAAVQRLEEEASAIHDSHPDVEVTVEAPNGHPGKVLIEAGYDADMLVVGSRGHGGFAGLLLGSVGHQVTTHPGAPAVVVVQ